jgi:transcriptional regulator with XRE-family HTH domain
MKASDATMTKALKEAIERSGLPLLTIEQRTGVKRATVLRFMRGDADIRLATADKLAAYFGVRVSKTKGK